MTTPKPIICGVPGTTLTDAEKAFYQQINPLGFVVFKKNLIDKAQSKALCNELRCVVGREDAPILIDQEGGAVNRLTSPTWRIPPSPLSLGKFAYAPIPDALERTATLVHLNAQLITYEMKEIGVNVNCAPVADLLIPGAHSITSTRSFGPDPVITATLVQNMASGLKAGGVQAIMKHMIGQGRAPKDSHLELPIVKESLSLLEETDFSVFRAAQAIEWGMTAHILYDALDPQEISTFSSKTIDYIRNQIGFKGVLITDCFTMKALPGTWSERTEKALNAGHDLIFYGGSNVAVITEIAQHAPNLSPDHFTRVQQSLASIHHQPPIDYVKILAAYHQLLASMEAELNTIPASRFSPALQLITEVLRNRSHADADYSSPLYKA